MPGAVDRLKLILMGKTVDETQAALDQIAGIDAIALKNGKAFGVAFRVQWGRDWQTMTVRYKRTSGYDTEFQKYDFAQKCLQPDWTCQVYLNEGKIGVYLAETQTLMRYAHDNEMTLTQREANGEGNIFLVVEASDNEWIRRKTVDCDDCRRRRNVA